MKKEGDKIEDIWIVPIIGDFAKAHRFVPDDDCASVRTALSFHKCCLTHFISALLRLIGWVWR